MKHFLEVGAPRLLALATILDAADALHREKKEPKYNQTEYVHDCGTPACAIGHYAASEVAGNRWRIKKNFNGFRTTFRVWHRRHGYDIDSGAVAEFGITEDEADELFSFDGCGNARTGKQAANYIRAFVKRKVVCKVGGDK